jgi:hypothetical protein
VRQRTAIRLTGRQYRSASALTQPI